MKFETRSGCKLLSLSLSATKENNYLELSLSPQHPLCYAAMLLKFIYYAQFCMSHVAYNFIQTVILECINENTNNRYHTMTVLLEYIDRSLGFSINA